MDPRAHAHPSLADTLQTQVSMMMVEARRADAKGYVVLIQGNCSTYGETDREKHPIEDDVLYSPFLGAFDALITHYWRQARRRIVVVHVISEFPRVSPGARPLEGKFTFSFVLHRTRRMRALVSAMDLFSRHRAARYSSEITGTGFLLCTHHSNHWVYTGEGRDALQTVLKILEMPNHREMLVQE